MPRVPAQPAKRRGYCRTEFHPDAEEYLKDLADDIGAQVAYVIRLCVQRALPEVEAELRDAAAHGRELPADELKKPTKPLRTTLRKPKPTPDASRLTPPPIAEFLETGEMPAPEPAEPPAEDLPRSDPQAPEEQAGPAADSPPSPDPGEASPPSSDDLFRAKLARVKTMRRG